MKILMATMGLDIGGAETHIIELAKGLSRLDNEVLIVSNGGIYLEELEKANITHVSAPLTSMNPFHLIKSYFVLRKAILRFKPDIVHAHARIPAFLCGLIRKFHKFHFVTTAHFPFKTSLSYKLFSNWGERALAVSEDLKTYLIEKYNYPEERIDITVNGIDTDKFCPVDEYSDILYDLEIAYNAPRIVCISRLTDDTCNHIFSLLEIFEKLQRTIPGLEVIIVGEGNMRGKLSNIAKEINEKIMRRGIILTGARTDVNKIIATATISIGVSRAILEPMAMEKPVIVTGLAGYIGIFDKTKLDEAVRTNFTCRGCRQLDKNELYDDIITLFKLSETEQKEMGSYCRGVVREYYSISKMVNDNLEMYRKVLENKTYDVVIMGNYGCKDNDEEAILQAMTSELKKRMPEIKMIVMSDNPPETVRLHKVEAFNRKNFMKLFSVLRHTKLLIAGSGNLLQDLTGSKPLLHYIRCMKTAKSANMKVMLYANNIGPLNNKYNRKKVSKILNSIDCITLRDTESASELEKLKVTNTPVILSADPIFALFNPDYLNSGDIFNKYGIGENEKYVCISVREWKEAPKNFFNAIADMGDYIAATYHYTPVFIPTHYPFDAYFSRNIIKEMHHKAIFIDESLNLQDTFSLINKSELIISIRLQMLIYASVLAVPAIGISNDPKTGSFQKHIGQAFSMNAKSLLLGEYKPLIESCLKNRENIKSKLTENVDAMKEKALISPEIAIKLIKGENIKFYKAGTKS